MTSRRACRWCSEEGRVASDGCRVKSNSTGANGVNGEFFSKTSVSSVDSYSTRPRHTGCIALSIIVGSLIFSACTTYEPVPAYTPAPSGFDRSWSAAAGAARDVGVRVDSEDRSRGVIAGTRDGRDVTIAVSTQADGHVRVEISARGPAGSDSNLVNEISRAYDRRMGR